MRRFAYRAQAAIAAAVLGVLGTCVAAGSQSEPFSIDVILPQTGPAANLGASEIDALRAVEKEVNAAGGVRGRPVAFALHDNQSNALVDLQLAGAIVAKHPAIVVDGGPATACRASGSLYAAGPVQWCISPAYYPPRGGFAFSTGVDSRDGAQTLLTFLRHTALRRIAVLTSTDIAGQEAETALRTLITMPANRDLSVVGWERFAPADTSTAAQLAKLRAENPQVLIAWVTGAPIATVLTGLRDGGWNVPVVASNAVQSYSLTAQYAPILPKTFYIYSLAWPAYASQPPGPFKTAVTKYLAAMAAVNGHPDGNTAMTYDAALLITNAFDRLGTSATPDAIRSYVGALHGYAGVSGTFDFRRGDQRGLGLDDCIVTKWDPATASWTPASGPAGLPLGPQH